jgi:hypothetical protein
MTFRAIITALIAASSISKGKLSESLMFSEQDNNTHTRCLQTELAGCPGIEQITSILSF